MRFTAQRLLVEGGHAKAEPLRALALDEQQPETARIHALWTLYLTGQLDDATLVSAMGSGSDVVAQNALKIAAELPKLSPGAVAALGRRLPDPAPRTGLAALIALGAADPTPELASTLLALVPTLKDPYLLSAALAGASRAPGAYLEAALRQKADLDPALASFTGQLSRLIAGQPAAAAKLLTALSAPEIPPARALPILNGLSNAGRTAPAPPFTRELQASLYRLIHAPGAPRGGASARPRLG